MDKFGINTQRWRLALTPEDALKGAKELSIHFPSISTNKCYSRSRRISSESTNTCRRKRQRTL
jgi:hypothetical protein